MSEDVPRSCMLRVIDRLALLGSRDIPGMQSCDYHGHSSDEDRKLCQAEGERRTGRFVTIVEVSNGVERWKNQKEGTWRRKRKQRTQERSKSDSARMKHKKQENKTSCTVKPGSGWAVKQPETPASVFTWSTILCFPYLFQDLCQKTAS